MKINKIEFKFWLEIVVSIILASTALYFGYAQSTLLESQLKIDKINSSPSFDVVYEIKENKSNEYYEDYLVIYNYGANAFEVNVSHHTFLTAELSEMTGGKRNIFQREMYGYFIGGAKVSNAQGHSYTVLGHKNREKYFKVSSEFENLARFKKLVPEIDLFTVVRINFKNMFGENSNQYFEVRSLSTKKIDESQYESYLENISDVVDEHFFDLDRLTGQKLFELTMKEEIRKL